MDTRHPDEGTLHAYAEGQLPPAERARVDEHVSECPDCSAVVAEARGLIAAASRIVGALDGVPGHVIPARHVRRLPPWVAAAAVVMLAVGVSTVAVRSGRDLHESRAVVETDLATPGMKETVERAAPQPPAEGRVAPQVLERIAAPAASRPRREETSRGERRIAEAGAEAGAAAESASDLSANASVREEATGRIAAPAASPPPPAVPLAAEADFARRARAGGVASTPTAPAEAIATAETGAAESARAKVSGRPTGQSLRQATATITGRVISQEGRPIAGASVVIHDLNISTRTDGAGNYTLTIPHDRLEGQSATIRARAIGYSPRSREIRLALESRTMDFELRREASELSEVAVAGVGTGETARAGISRDAATPPPRQQVGTGAPIRTVRYEASPGLPIELREFDATVSIPRPQEGMNEYRWSDAAGLRTYVLSGVLPVVELERLSRRLGELEVLR